MIDRAACAGMALGVGVLLLIQQVTADNPVFFLVLLGIGLTVVGAVFWADLREARAEERAEVAEELRA